MTRLRSAKLTHPVMPRRARKLLGGNPFSSPPEAGRLGSFHEQTRSFLASAEGLERASGTIAHFG